MNPSELEEATQRALLDYIELLRDSADLAALRLSALLELEVKNSELMAVIERQNSTIKDLSQEVLELRESWGRMDADLRSLRAGLPGTDK